MKKSLSVARIVYASLLEVPNLGWRPSSVGAISALRSPQSKDAIAGTDPRIGVDNQSLIHDSSGNPRMKVDFAPAISGSFRTTRGQAGAAAVGTAGVANISGVSTSDIIYDKRIEFEIRETWATSDIFQTPDAISYINGLLKPNVNTNMNDAKYKPAREMLGKVGLEFVRRADADLLVPMNDSMLTTLVAAVGKNAAYPTALTPFCPQITAFKADGQTPLPDLFNAIRQTVRLNKFQGIPIVIGGAKLSKYFDAENVTAVADSGFDLSSLIRETKVEFHYDERIDTIFGANKILVIEPNSAVANFFLEHDPVYGTVKVSNQALMYYGTGSLDIIQHTEVDVMRDASPGSYAIDYDLRILEGLDANDRPINSIVPSALFGVWTRPTNYLTTVSGNILKDVTGVYAFELTNASA